MRIAELFRWSCGTGLALLVVLVSYGETADVVVRRTKGANTVDEAIVVPATRTTMELKGLLNRFFETQRKDGRGLFRMTVGHDPASTLEALRHGDHRRSFASTVADVGAHGLPQGRVVQLVGIGDEAIVRWREGGTYTEYLVPGKTKRDPTILRLANGTAFHLLHFELAIPGPSWTERDYYATVFLKSPGGLSITASFEVLRRLRALTKLPNLHVDIRRDDWFIESPDFPLLFPFTPDMRLPSEAEYRLGPHVACGYTWKYEPTCSGSGFRE